MSDSEDAKAALEHGGADFAVLTSDSEMSSSTLVAEPVCDHELILVASPDDTDVGDVVAIEDLSGLRYVCSPGTRPRRRLVDAALETIGVRDRRIAIQLGHPEALKRATAPASGCASCCARRSCPSWSTGRCARWRSRARLTVPIVIVQRADKRFSPLQDVLRATIRETLVERTRPEPRGRGRPAVGDRATTARADTRSA